MQLETDFGDIVFEFDKEIYKDYYCEINTNIFQLNFSGTHDWYYFISIQDNKLNTFQYNIDEYPIYFADLNIPNIKLIANNMKDFLSQWFPNDKLSFLSNKYIKQNMPIITKKIL